jgi:hypothetical protein
MSALGRNDVLAQAVKDELERLGKGGYLKPAEVERLSGECVKALEGQVARARGVVGPLVSGLAGQVREALDLPSRAEIRALTEALARAEAAKVATKDATDPA